MSPQVTQAGRQTFGSVFKPHQPDGIETSRAMPPYRGRESGYSDLFFIALFISVTSSIGFIWLFVSLLLGG